MADSAGENNQPCEICGTLSDKKCSACNSVYYCGSEHQKKDWKNHKGICKGYEVRKNEVFGRYLAATRDIEAGKIILQEECAMYGPNRITHPICLGCFKNLDGSYYCSGCGFPLCGVQCEKESLHTSYECQVFSRKKLGFKISDFETEHPAYECVLPLRCLLLKLKKPKLWEKMKTMEHHNDLRRKIDHIWQRNEINTVTRLRSWYGLKDEFDAETIHSVIGFIDVNAFEMKLPNGISISAVFIEGALMAHDCTPNTHHAVCLDRKLIVRAGSNISKNSIISTSYAESLHSTKYRQEFLRHTKYFTCTCKRCMDPTEFGTYFSAVKCFSSDCSSGYMIPIQLNEPTPLVESLEEEPQLVWKCTECDRKSDDSRIEVLIETIRENVRNGMSIQEMEKLVEKYSTTLLNPNHFVLIDIYQRLNKAYGRQKGYQLQDLSESALKRKIEICNRLLKIFQKIVPGISRSKAVALYEKYAASYILLNRANKEIDVDHVHVLKELNTLLDDLKFVKTAMELDRLIGFSKFPDTVDDSIKILEREIEMRKITDRS